MKLVRLARLADASRSDAASIELATPAPVPAVAAAPTSLSAEEALEAVRASLVRTMLPVAADVLASG